MRWAFVQVSQNLNRRNGSYRWATYLRGEKFVICKLISTVRENAALEPVGQVIRGPPDESNEDDGQTYGTDKFGTVPIRKLTQCKESWSEGWVKPRRVDRWCFLAKSSRSPVPTGGPARHPFLVRTPYDPTPPAMPKGIQ